MSTQFQTGSVNPAAARLPTNTNTISWQTWCLLFAITSTLAGLYWDLSWHRSIGRDSFWTPAHVAIYLGGVLGGGTAAFNILHTTFAKGRFAQGNQRLSVRIWGFRGSLASFVCAWGATAMLTSAPFDNWWHNAYGLDVKILSPPHVLLLLGILAVQFGGVLSVLQVRANVPIAARVRFDQLLLYSGGILLATVMITFEEYTFRVMLHNALPYAVLSLAVPVLLLGIGTASGRKWACTAIAAIYMLAGVAQLWVLPLFAAEPKLGPVYHRITHFVPDVFPLLLLAPALALDVWRARDFYPQHRWLRAAIGGTAFLGGLVAVEWPFASFLMLPAARNWFFGTNYVAYLDNWPDPEFLYRFQQLPSFPELCIGMIVALCLAILSVRAGMIFGGRLALLRR